MNSTNTLYDALGPVLGKYYKDAATLVSCRRPPSSCLT